MGINVEFRNIREEVLGYVGDPNYDVVRLFEKAFSDDFPLLR